MPSPRVLVAEDDRFIASLIRQTLEDAGFTIDVALNGGDALLQADEVYPDLIILDVSMPVMTGMEVLRALKGDRFQREVPVLMLTASRGKQEVLEAIENGAADYLTKPFQPTQLIKRVKRLLKSRGSSPSIAALAC